MPGRFLDPLKVQLLPAVRRRFWQKSRRRWRLLSDFAYSPSWDVSGADVETVPVGTVVDGASIPCFFWRLVGPPMGPYAESSVIHDWLWELAARDDDGYDLAFANLVFRDALRTQGISFWKRWTMWLAVTVNGHYLVWRHFLQTLSLGDEK